MARAELGDAGKITVECEYRDRDLIRAIPGAKWMKDRDWSVPLSWPTCLALRGVFGERLELGEYLIRWATDHRAELIDPVLALREAALDPSNDTEGDSRLYPFQRTGVAFLARSGGALLLDEMGAGKTLQTISTLEEIDAYPALIVCPKVVKQVWADEFKKWAPHRSVTVVTNGAKAKQQLIAETDVTVVNYERLRLASRIAGYGSIRLKPEEKVDKELNRPWAAVIADEAHRAKDPKATQTRALWAVGASADVAFALTGTPIANDPRDLWSLLHFIAPGEWPSRTKFIDRYCLVQHNYFGGVDILGLREDTKDEFFAASDYRILRRPKALILPQLPPKTRATRYVEMSPKQATAYKAMKKNMVAELDNGALATAFDSLTALRRLSQFASSYATVNENDEVRLEPPSSKCDAVVELLEEMGDDQLVVFAESRQLIDLMEQRLIKEGITNARITGSDTESKRKDAIASFRSGDARVIMLTLAAGSEGITLTEASTVCFMQRSFNAVHNAQAEDRIHRPGQTADNVVIIDLIAPNTVEETVVLPALQGKADMLEEVTRDRDILRRLIAN